MKEKDGLVAMIAGTLIAGAHPDQAQQTQLIPGYVKTARLIVAESEKQCALDMAPEPTTGGGLRNPNNPSPPEGPVI